MTTAAVFSLAGIAPAHATGSSDIDWEMFRAGWMSPKGVEYCKELNSRTIRPAVGITMVGAPSIKMLLTSSQGKDEPSCDLIRYASSFDEWLQNLNAGSS